MVNSETVKEVLDTIKEMQREKDNKRITPNYALYVDLTQRLKDKISDTDMRMALNKLFSQGKIMINHTMAGKAISAI